MIVADSIYHPTLGMNIDSNGVGLRPQECVDAVNVDILQSETRPRRAFVPLQNSGTEPTETIIHYAAYQDPEEGNLLFGFGSETIWLYTAGAGWSDVTGVSLAGLGIDQWSTTPAVDNAIGATLVASGYQFVGSSSAMGGGSERRLLYYDRSAGEFAALDMTADRAVSEEDTGVVTVASGVVTSTSALSATSDSDFVQIEAGSVNFYTVLGGSLAKSGNVIFDNGGTPAYHLIPADDTVVKYGSNSWVNVDGSAWSIEFVGGAASRAILVDYDYSRDVDYKPMQVAFFRSALILGSTYEEMTYFPWRIRHTVQGNIFKTKEIYFDDGVVSDISPIVRLTTQSFSQSSNIDSFLYVYKQESILRGAYNSGFNQDPNVVVPFFTFTTGYDEGIEAGRTVVQVGNNQLYLGRNDVYAFTGSERISLTLDSNTGATRIRDYIFDNLDLDDIKYDFAVYDELAKRYMLFLRRQGASGTYPVECFVFYVDRNVWTRYTIPETGAAINILLNASGSINDLPGAIEGLPGNIEDLSGAADKLLICSMLSSAYYLSGVGGSDKGSEEIESYLITRDFFGETLEHQDRTEKLYLEGRGDTLAISQATEYNLNTSEFAQEQTVAFTSRNTRKEYNPDVTSNTVRFLITLQGSTRLRWIQPFSMRQELFNN